MILMSELHMEDQGLYLSLQIYFFQFIGFIMIIYIHLGFNFLQQPLAQCWITFDLIMHIGIFKTLESSTGHAETYIIVFSCWSISFLPALLALVYNFFFLTPTCCISLSLSTCKGDTIGCKCFIFGHFDHCMQNLVIFFIM